MRPRLPRSPRLRPTPHPRKPPETLHHRHPRLRRPPAPSFKHAPFFRLLLLWPQRPRDHALLRHRARLVPPRRHPSTRRLLRRRHHHQRLKHAHRSLALKLPAQEIRRELRARDPRQPARRRIQPVKRPRLLPARRSHFIKQDRPRRPIRLRLRPRRAALLHYRLTRRLRKEPHDDILKTTGRQRHRPPPCPPRATPRKRNSSPAM